MASGEADGKERPREVDCPRWSRWREEADVTTEIGVRSRKNLSWLATPWHTSGPSEEVERLCRGWMSSSGCSDGLVRIPYLPCPAEELLRECLRTLHSVLQCWGVFCEPGTLQGPRVCWGGKQCPYARRSGWSGVEVCVKCTGTGVRGTWVPAGRISLMGCNLFPLSDSAAAAVRFCPQAALSWFLHYSHL